MLERCINLIIFDIVLVNMINGIFQLQSIYLIKKLFSSSSMQFSTE